MNLYNLSANAFSQYVGLVKNNKDMTYRQARLKLTRNILLSTKVEENCGVFDGTWYAYGSLRIFVNEKHNEITCILNYQPIYKNWVRNDDLKERLNKVLGIK